MKTLRYQEKAVKALVEQSLQLLQNPEDEQNLVFKAPTGSGKTIMATRVLADLYDALEAEGLTQVAFVWIAPQKLHLQSFEKLKKIFAEDHKLSPILFDDINQADGVIKPGEILFVNWESVNKDGNLMVQERENADSFFEIIERTCKEQHHPIYLIVDEEHRNWSKNADKSLQVVKKIHPKVELRISATPKTVSFNAVNIPRREVIEEEMIKKGINLNEDIDVNNDDPNLNMHLLHKALDMRQSIADEYRKLGVNINPLLLIQLPNDNSETLNADERTLAESLIKMLEVQYNITEENGLLGTWLSGKKTIGDEISNNDDMTQVLLFKQAIALGWDCPRAAVLLIFRNLESEEFTVQTLGRILRMPEQHFYPADILNYGHVYTDISKDKIKIAAEDTNYISKDTLRAERRKNLNNITLVSYHQEYKSADRTRLGVGFKKCLIEEVGKYLGLKLDNNFLTIAEMENWSEEDYQKYENPTAIFGTSVEFNRKKAEEKNLNMNVHSINVRIPKGVVIQNDESEVDLTDHQSPFARTQSEIQRAFGNYCHSMVSRAHFEPKYSSRKLAMTLSEVMEELFGFFETDVPKIILSNDSVHHNVKKFTPVIERALAAYNKNRADRLNKKNERSFKQDIWEVPEERYYKMSTHKVDDDVRNHALLPFVELLEASTPENRFKKYLEENTQYIDWWYKNGDEGMANYSIPYVKDHGPQKGEKALFYVDFVIRMRDGHVFLFDTKSEESDPDAPAKHNALIDYMKAENTKGKKLDGGVIIEDKHTPDLWRYSIDKIDNTEETTGWNVFSPDQYKSSNQ